MTEYFPIEQEDIKILSKQDKAMGAAIEAIGPIQREVFPGAFRGLVRAVSGQQISSAAHKGVWERINASFSLEDPGAMAAASLESIRACGLSRAKAACVQNIAAMFKSGELTDKELEEMGDYSLSARLSALPGIGQWTVDMFMIFTLKRKDVFNKDDKGIQKGLRMLYGREKLTRYFLEDSLYTKYRCYSSIASLYLWEIASGQYPWWHDPARPKTPAKKRGKPSA